MGRIDKLVALVATLVATAGVSACGEDDTGGGAASAPQGSPIILATTTSTQDSGLLDVLVPAFERASGRRVKTLAVGSGQAIELGRRGEADVVLAHSPAAEEELMAGGVAAQRRLVMHNDFVVVGPSADPAGIAQREPVPAFQAIATRRARFVSRGDDSGTHKFELKLWEGAGVAPKGAWYEESGQGMGATLRIAAEKDAYTLADRATYLATQQRERLTILVEGGGELLNLYHVIDITTKAGSRVNEAGGRAFADWVVSPAAQKLIGAFGVAKHGQPLFTPDAGKTPAQVKAAG